MINNHDLVHKLISDSTDIMTDIAAGRYKIPTLNRYNLIENTIKEISKLVFHNSNLSGEALVSEIYAHFRVEETL